ncbi:sialidase-3 [Coturnix japonica]|uniref:exo-alpha-sialidase n=1 Tax=Coturnix japonica TaxID=93934 RepID=A0A8C2T1F0_COTJA|nr:sialidase-3 [Coturnix japonica]XP_015708123.1 sialidase-3 [Coturnix japonica]XP_032298210.1 sialidase-3 [Coturnix japonica]
MAQAVTWLKWLCGAKECPQTPEAPLNPPRETLFRQEGPQGVTFRIPALLHVPPRTFLAFAEKRSSVRDEDAEFLVLRRGRWNGHKVEWGPMEELTELTLPDHRTMNPCPLYEAASGTVFLFFICVERHVTEWQQIILGRNAARLCCSSSPDHGRTWSPLRDLTDEAISDDQPRWATFAVGPGHGVQLDSGRLAVPAYAYYMHGRLCGIPLPCCTRPHSFIFYSDDGGRSWQKGSLLRGMRTGECQVAEISAKDGGTLLYCSARRPCRCRAVAISADRGQRFGLPVRCPALCEPPRGCQGSVVSFVPTTIGGPVGNTDTESPSGVTQHGPLCSNSTNQHLQCNSGCESPTGDTQHCLLCTTPPAIIGCPTGTTSPENPNRVSQLCSHPTNQQQHPDLGLCINTTPHSEYPVGTTSIESPNGDTQHWLLCSNPTHQLQRCDLGTKSLNGGTQRWLLYSHPTNRHHRRDLGLYVNMAPPDEKGWRHPRVLQEGPCGYSDLAVCPDGVFGCLFECGEVSTCEEIAFCLFTLGAIGGAADGEGSETPCLGEEPVFGVLSPKSNGESSGEDVRDENPAEEKQRCEAFN